VVLIAIVVMATKAMTTTKTTRRRIDHGSGSLNRHRFLRTRWRHLIKRERRSVSVHLAKTYLWKNWKDERGNELSVLSDSVTRLTIRRKPKEKRIYMDIAIVTPQRLAAVAGAKAVEVAIELRPITIMRGRGDAKEEEIEEFGVHKRREENIVIPITMAQEQRRWLLRQFLVPRRSGLLRIFIHRGLRSAP
jgi:hypothetical protein